MPLIDVRGADAYATRLRDLAQQAPFAVLRAIRRTRSAVMAEWARAIAFPSGLDVKRIRKSMHGSQPSLTNPDVAITLWGGRSPLVKYGSAVQQRNMPGSGFVVRVRGASRSGTGHTGVFERRPGEASLRPIPGRAKATRIRPGVWHSLPIDEAYGPKLTEFGDATVASISRFGARAFVRNLEREIAFRESRRSAA